MLAELIRKAKIRDVIVSERMKVYEASFKFAVEDAPEYSYFFSLIQFVPRRDKIKITLQDENDRIYNFSITDEDSYKKFVSDTLSDEIIDVKIRIDKEVSENHFSIYSVDEFVKDILSLSIEEVMRSFSCLLKLSPDFLIFDVYSSIPMFATKTMFFVPYENGKITTDFDRIRRIQDNVNPAINYRLPDPTHWLL